MNQMISHAFNWVDYFIIGVVLLSTLISLMRGFISEAISLLTWIAAALIAFMATAHVGNLLSKMIHTQSLRLMVAFLIVFIVILIIGSLINYMVSVVIRRTGLSGTNRLLGMVFGFGRGVLLIAIFVLFAEMTSVTKDAWWQHSQLIPYFHGVAAWLKQFIPQHFNNVSHYFSKSQAGNM